MTQQLWRTQIQKKNSKYRDNNNLWSTFLGSLPKLGSDMLLLCIDMRLLPSADAGVINEDIVIVDWLEDTRGALDWWSCSPCWPLLCDVEGVGGGKPPTTRWAVLSKKLNHLPSFARAKLVAYPPYKWCNHYFTTLGMTQSIVVGKHTCWWIFTRSSREDTICLHASTSGDLPVFKDFNTAWQYLNKCYKVMIWKWIP